jgi:hypothetical protein
MGSGRRVVPSMNPYRWWNPSGNGEMAALGIGVSKNRWDGTLALYK